MSNENKRRVAAKDKLRVAAAKNVVENIEVKSIPPIFGKVESLLIAPRPIANDAPSVLRLFTGWPAICINKVADTMISLPLKMYVVKQNTEQKCVWNTKKLSRATQDNIRSRAKSLKIKSALDIEEITEHSMFDVLNEVQDDMCWTDLVKMTVQYVLMIGNAYWYINRNSRGLPTGIRCLPAEYTMVLLSKGNEMNITSYQVYNGIRQEELRAEDVIHFKKVAPGLFWRISSGELKTGLYGMGAIESILNPVMLLNAIDDFERALMENMCVPSGFIKYNDGTLTPEAMKIAEAQWNKAVGGLKRAGRTKVMDQNWEYKPMSIPPKDMSYGEARKWLREVVANACGVPMSLITPDESNKASSTVAIANYMKFTVLPMCEMLTDKINKMLVKKFDDNIFVAFDNPVREDNEFLLEQDKTQITLGMITVNEWRMRQGLEPVPWGDDRYEP